MTDKRDLPDGFTDKIITTHERAVELGRKGGKKSGEVRKKKRDMKEALAAMLELPMREGALDDPKCFEDIFSVLDFDHRKSKVQNVNVAEAIVAAQIREAIRGNVKAAEFISRLGDMIDTAGQRGDDGFLQALNGTAVQDWSDGDEEPE